MSRIISLTKNYCITISIKKISSIYKFILKIQQILGLMNLKGKDQFDHVHPEIIESSFIFPELVPPCKKPVNFRFM